MSIRPKHSGITAMQHSFSPIKLSGCEYRIGSTYLEKQFSHPLIRRTQQDVLLNE